MPDDRSSPVTDEALALADKLSKLPMYYHKALNHNGGAYVEISDSMRVDLYSVLRALAQRQPEGRDLTDLEGKLIQQALIDSGTPLYAPAQSPLPGLVSTLRSHADDCENEERWAVPELAPDGGEVLK